MCVEEKLTEELFHLRINFNVAESLVSLGQEWKQGCSSFGWYLKAEGRTAMSLLSVSQAAANANIGGASKL